MKSKTGNDSPHSVDSSLTEAYPSQIIATGDSSNDFFEFKKDNLESIINKVPVGMEVAVLSVVGGFRSGKSFILNFFLRYLRNSQSTLELNLEWMTADGTSLGGNSPLPNPGEDWNVVESAKTSTFAWRGGEKRQTTGIWIWSEPFIRKTSATNGKEVAILLMDTQGIFDNETTMSVTTQIFGLSTLVSSFQVYNVEKMIHEDKLQHLALFSEYGRLALQPNEAQVINKVTPDTPPEAPTAETPAVMPPPPPSEADTSTTPVTPPPTPTATPAVAKPFQCIQFLVRDWQNFKFDVDALVGEGPLQSMSEAAAVVLQEEMDAYLDTVMKPRALADLQSSREQITRCFEKTACFLLPHPGNAVTKIKYSGEIALIDPSFRILLDRYVRSLFDHQLAAKTINGHTLTGKELLTFFEEYVKIFTETNDFPTPQTILGATSEANNRNALDRALQLYKSILEKKVGEQSTGFVAETELLVDHQKAENDAMEYFNNKATMGSVANIEEFRSKLVGKVGEEKVRYFTTNALRNPYKDIEQYIVPLVVAALAWFFAALLNRTCSHDVCEQTEFTLVKVYSFIFFVLFVLLWSHFSGSIAHLKNMVLPLLNEEQQKLVHSVLG